MARPITSEERTAWGLELSAATRRPAYTKSADCAATDLERSHKAYVDQLDIAATRLLAVECLRKLMRKRSRDHKLSVVAWIANAARTLAVEDFGTVRDHLPNFEKTLATAERLRKGKRR